MRVLVLGGSGGTGRKLREAAGGLDVTVIRPMRRVDGERAGEAQPVEPDAKAPSAKVSRFIGKLPVLRG